jgi:hypothetical protein
VEVVYDVTFFEKYFECYKNGEQPAISVKGESTDPEKDNCSSTDDDFVAECSYADSSVHTPAPLETSRSSVQRRTRLGSGKRPLEEAMIEIERKKLDLMQSMGMDVRTGTRHTTF